MARELATAGEIAKAIGRSVRYVQELYGLGMPRTLPEARDWFDARKQEREAKRAAGLEEARRQKVEYEARLLHMEILVKEGELMPTAEHRSRLASIVDLVRARLLAMPGRYAPQLVGKRTMAESMLTLESMTTEVLTDLASLADG